MRTHSRHRINHQAIIGDVSRVIRRMRDPELALSSFLKSPQLKRFCRKFKGHTLSQIHESFVIMDRFSAIIRKQKALLYSEGRKYNGLEFELHRTPRLKNYVQKMYNDSRGIMVFCAFHDQMSMLLSLGSLEIDIRGKEFTEVTFATFLPNHGESIFHYLPPSCY